MPSVERSSNLRAAGVKAPSARRGVHDGGGIEPFLAEFPRLVLTDDGVRIPGRPRSSALARRFFEAVFDNLCERRSRAVGAAIWKLVGGGSMASAGSSDCERMRGVAFSVPHVMSCFTALGPISEGDGEGTEGMSAFVLVVGDLGRSGKSMS